ncbi:M3 family metallopeptidase [Corynebacterium sp. YIM 101645]|uniref:M3 family metallopeptidase n=1 Tax=Corynebacterium lemuris TaxID=1859292 RepID=A0ABT2G1J7_9CORY|nr:M3 family metallopeptidase [Corynebacterium lemuris]MCS5480142.1 M3 family metallopeptidase [Corynebacterium lemuris]
MTSNPLLAPSTLPYQLPDFANIRLEHAVAAFEPALAEQRAEITAITESPEAASWENTVEALEASGAMLDRVTAWLFNLQGTDSTDELDAEISRMVPLLSAHSDAIYQDEALYERLRAVTPPADPEAQRLHELLLRRFTRRGADLDAAGKARLAEINQRLSSLSESFGRQLLADTRELAVLFDDPAALAGLSESRIASAKAAAEQAGKEGWLLPLELPTVQSDQLVLSSPEARAALYEASQRRGLDTNRGNLLEQVRLRAERAQLLGYDTHADYVIAEETAGTADAARQLLFDLAPAAAANADAERKLAGELAGADLGGADWPYWQAKVRERDFSFDEEELSRYFPLDRVLVDGVFHAASVLYGISVVPRADLAGYSEGVDVWEVLDADGTGLGLLLTDYRARPAKRGGAWMSSFVRQSGLLGTRPVVVNVMGITHPVDGSQPLLTIDQVTTVFHEFGHALHGLLSDVRYPTLAGTSVPRDWVEFPSQINENWAFEPDIVRNYARHVDTGEIIPQELLDAIVASRQFGQGFATSEYLAAAIIDLAWHSLTPSQAAQVSDIEGFEQAALEEAGLIVEELAPRYRSTYFNHIFGGGYSAGYYSYLWAEALDADGFDWFREAGDLREAGEKFREHILSRGASVDYTDAFRELRGRDKDVTPLLNRRGLAGVSLG